MFSYAELTVFQSMKICLLCIGNELLAGKTINTNAAWISRSISYLGPKVVLQTVVPDHEPSIIGMLRQMINEQAPSCIIITGGLGPTEDDVTRSALFSFVDATEKFDKKYWNELTKRFRARGYNIPQSNMSQAIIPSSGEIIENPIGSARGFKFVTSQTTLIALPGVPNEMKVMMEESVLPWIAAKNKSEFYSCRLRTTGIPESEIVEILKEPLSTDHGCTIGYYPSEYGVDLQISSKKIDNVNEFKKIACEVLGPIIYSDQNVDLQEVLVKYALKNKKTISVAESCTGGLIGSRITDVPGSSEVFLGGVLAYSDKIKEKILGIDKNLIGKYGAVSSEVVIKMAQGVKSKFKADIGIAVSGIAGPSGGTNEKPVGLVYICFSSAGKEKVIKHTFGSVRSLNKIRASQAALNLTRMELMKSD